MKISQIEEIINYLEKIKEEKNIYKIFVEDKIVLKEDKIKWENFHKILTIKIEYS